MKVPLLDLQAQLKSFESEMVSAVTDVVRSTRYIGGPEIEGLEKKSVNIQVPNMVSESPPAQMRCLSHSWRLT